MGLAGCEPNITDKDVQPVSLMDVVGRVNRIEQNPNSKALLLVDPRSSERFAAGHIPGARNIGLAEIPARGPRNPDLAQYSMIVVYGEEPNSPVARAMTKRLIGVGYKPVRMLEGGLAAWKAAGNRVETLND